MILTDFSKAVSQFLDPRFRRVLFLGIGLTVALLVATYALVLWLISYFFGGSLTLPFLGEVTWVGDLVGWGSLFLILGLSVFLMIPVASAITSFFLEDVADAVEDEFYPGLPPAPRTGFAEGLKETVAFLGLMIVANLMAFGLYLTVPFLSPVIFYTLNGFLLGREYFQMAAMRREGRAGAIAMQARNRGQIWLAGCLMALPLTIPLLNLVIPVLAAATFTHLYHRIKAGEVASGRR
ncbi:MAG: EI24 domain-containing protein [Rhodobacterales bacterium]|nr:EI24 domain-containing protein [Rhodobacterales bacterium]